MNARLALQPCRHPSRCRCRSSCRSPSLAGDDRDVAADRAVFGLVARIRGDVTAATHREVLRCAGIEVGDQRTVGQVAVDAVADLLTNPAADFKHMSVPGM